MKNFQKNKGLTVENRQKGFSLVELMVGVVIALIATVAVFQVFSVYESQKQATSSDSDAAQSANLAFFLLNNELQKAGQGFTTSRIKAGTSMALYGCKMAIFPFENRVPPLPKKEKNYISIEKAFDVSGDFFEGRNPDNDKWTLAPILIRTVKKAAENDFGGKKQDVLIAMRGTNSFEGIATVRDFEDTDKLQLGTATQTKAPLGFCSAGKQGAYCSEALLFVDKTLKKCHLTTTDHEWKPTYTNGVAHLPFKLQNNQTRATRNQVPDKTTYQGGYVINLGRLDRANFKNEATRGREGSGKDERIADKNLQHGGFALFAVGHLFEADTDKGTAGNLLRYDIMHDKVESLADNVMLMKAIYAVAPAEDANNKANSRDMSYDVASRNYTEWKAPTDREWTYDKLTEDTDDAREKIKRIRAVKVALVVRNSMPEIESLEEATQDITLTLFKNEISDTVTITKKTDDATYRYEVIEFLVPLQNTQYGIDQAYASCAKAEDECSKP